MSLLLPYQRRWIQDNSRIKLMEKSRQIGLSWAAAYAAVRHHASTKRKLDTWVSSRDEIQARLFLEDCKHFAQILHTAATEAAQSHVTNPTERPTTHTLTFANGTRIHSLTSNPDAQAGKRGTRILDEFALHPDPRKLYAIAYPGITWGGSLEIISTHRGSDNFFNQLINEAKHNGNPKNISLHRVTLQDALEQGFLAKLKQKLPPEDERQHMDEADYYNFIRASCADEESFQQEYLCNPADDQTAFLSYPDITSCQTADPLPAHLPSAPAFLGIDLARTQDLTAFYLLIQIGDVLYTHSITTFQDTPFHEQEAHLHHLFTTHNIRRACIDQSGIGRQFTERAQQRYGSHRIEGITFTTQTKEALAYPLRSALQARTLRIPEDPKLLADLRSVRRTFTSTGHARLDAQRSDQGHADRFWALALATHAATQPTHQHHYEPLSRNHLN